MTCKDCIHYCLCKYTLADENWREDTPQEIKDMYSPKGCENFKNKADVVEVEKVAEMFAEQFGDKCPCNFNDNDEWLTQFCDHTNTCNCPCYEGWKQFIKHYDKRKEAKYGEGVIL
jgi:hypothetical protein